jgi:YD repeat-containing protein
VEAWAVTLYDGMGRMYATGGDNPNSAGGYRAQVTLYDVMGRATDTTNPSEINSSWVPAGDDAAGWVWTHQAYDWKGRPTLTTNPDGTTKSATYGGCGCAGGEVVTVRDEVGRQQRVTSDILGRTWKTEVLDWYPSQTVYSTTTNTYNVRDQVTSVYQQVGSSGTGQTTSLTYDGHGRLKTQQSPSQTAATTYAYNRDDTVLNVTDGRGAVTNLTYNYRHQTTNISYSAPTGIAAIAAATFTYDAAGNRTSMSDGSGSVAYSYDQLSRLTSESRQFTGLSGAFPLSYSYNLVGGLTSVTDPTGAVVNYAYDKTGRMTDVTGSAFGGVTQYATSARYRAWGGVKAVNYGNGRALAVEHNTRLQVSRFDIPGVITKAYQYDADGGLHYSQDLRNQKFDRAYAYDHVGRVTQALSGIEARGGQSTTGRDRPYNESFQYDPMNHLTGRTTSYWDENHTLADEYVNDRNTYPLWSYDADGRVMVSPDVSYVYDAMGSAISFGDFSEVKTDQKFDGDGRRVRSEQWQFNEGTWAWESQRVTYYVSSSVLGGSVVTELEYNGDKRRTFVHAGGSILAWQWKGTSGVSDSVDWEHRDASGASFRTTNSTGDVIGETVASREEGYPQEIDAAGADAGLVAPLYLPPPMEEPMGSLLPYPMMREPSHPGVTYAMDGIPVTVDTFMSELNSHFASPFDVLQATLRGSTRVVGTRTTTERFTGRFQGHSSSGSDDLDAGIVRIGSGDAFAFSFTVTTQTPIYDSSSWSFSLIAGLQQPQGNPQRTAQQLRDDGINELKKRLHERPECAKLFGGEKKALKALDKIQFSFAHLGNSAIAQTIGKSITIDPAEFTEEGGMVYISQNIRNVKNAYGGYTTSWTEMMLTLSGTTFAAFGLFHEFGHVSKIYDKEYDNDGNIGNTFGFHLEQGANNEKIRMACFGELQPQKSGGGN